MASMGDLTVKIEIEPVVKLICEETACVYNMANMRMGDNYLCCNLKLLEIKEGGRCAMFRTAQPASEAEK